MQHYRRVITTVFVIATSIYAQSGYSEEDVWALLKQGGYVVVMRHATADKSADNARTLKINDCSVQRNLSMYGREEAIKIGKSFRAHDIPVSEVISSQYCRTNDTARLAFNRVSNWQPLNLLNALPASEREARTALVSERINAYRGRDNIIMVTHQPNITALTFEVVEPGEFLVLKPDQSGEFDVVGRLTPGDL